jgi:hypothetical protein
MKLSRERKIAKAILLMDGDIDDIIRFKIFRIKAKSKIKKNINLVTNQIIENIFDIID